MDEEHDSTVLDSISRDNASFHGNDSFRFRSILPLGIHSGRLGPCCSRYREISFLLEGDADPSSVLDWNNTGSMIPVRSRIYNSLDELVLVDRRGIEVFNDCRVDSFSSKTMVYDSTLRNYRRRDNLFLNHFLMEGALLFRSLDT